MVVQNTLRTFAGLYEKKKYIKFEAAIDVNKCHFALPNFLIHSTPIITSYRVIATK